MKAEEQAALLFAMIVPRKEQGCWWRECGGEQYANGTLTFTGVEKDYCLCWRHFHRLHEFIWELSRYGSEQKKGDTPQ